jgi:hypothetical protein
MKSVILEHILLFNPRWRQVVRSLHLKHETTFTVLITYLAYYRNCVFILFIFCELKCRQTENDRKNRTITQRSRHVPSDFSKLLQKLGVESISLGLLVYAYLMDCVFFKWRGKRKMVRPKIMQIESGGNWEIMSSQTITHEIQTHRALQSVQEPGGTVSEKGK